MANLGNIKSSSHFASFEYNKKSYYNFSVWNGLQADELNSFRTSVFDDKVHSKVQTKSNTIKEYLAKFTFGPELQKKIKMKSLQN